MKALKKALSFVTALALTLSMGIAGSALAADTPTNTFDVNSENVKYLGRHYEDGGYTWFSYGASGIRVNFTGTDFYAKAFTELSSGSTLDLMVLVDTEMPMEGTVFSLYSNKEEWLHLASGLEDGEHYITIMKMSRGIGGNCGFGTDHFTIKELAVNEGGTILPPDGYSDLVIEAYGDSITNGDAVWKNGDGSRSYTYGAYSGVVARLLGAELQATGNTGNGLNSWVLGAGNLFPPRESWDQVEPRDGQSAKPDHSETDVVIINLGTNDMNAINSDKEDCAIYTEEYFKETYIAWLTQIHEDAPDAIVIGALGAMGANILFDDIQAACNYVNAEAGENFAFFTQLQACNSFTGGLGYDNGHPSNYAHEVYGLQIAKMINTALDLGMDEELNAHVPFDTTFDYDNLAPHATAYDAGYSVFGGTAVADNVNDANKNSGWQYANGTDISLNDSTMEVTDCWVAFEFPQATAVSKFNITWEAGTRAATDGYTVQYSEDGITWVDITNAEYACDEANDIVSFEEITAKYFRINITKGTNNKYCPKIFEVAMYGDGEIPYDPVIPNPPVDPNPPFDPDAPVNPDTPDVPVDGKGDVNGDGLINSTDFMQVRRHFLNLYDIPEEQHDAADVNDDGLINSTDFMQIRRHFLGLYVIGA